jgi:lysophospholipase L1-like esterase
MRNTQPFISATRRVFCLGDSLTEGVVPATNGTTFFPYSLQLQKSLRELVGLESIQVQTLTFRGLPLATLRTSLRSTLNRMSKTCKPLLLTLIGIQDVMEGADYNTIVQSIIDIHQDAHQRGIQTIAIGLPTSELQGKFFEFRATVEQVNRELILWASYNHMVAFVPFPISQYCNKILARDGFHFTEEGYRLIGARLTPIVHESLSRR